jgi:hypothetical protein
MTRQLTVAREMAAAELLRLRRKRGLMALALFTIAGVFAIYVGYGALAHAISPTHNGPAGGLHRFATGFQFLGLFVGPIAATLIGAESGAGDLAAGVFRDQVVTGRSRLALFLAKVPAVLAVTLMLSAVAFAIAAGSAFLFASNLPTPSFSVVTLAAEWLALANAIAALVALGLASLCGSRPATISTLMGWELVIGTQLLGVTGLGHARDVLVNSALAVLVPGPRVPILTSISMSAIVAVVVLVGWAVVLPALGAWRTLARDA